MGSGCCLFPEASVERLLLCELNMDARTTPVARVQRPTSTCCSTKAGSLCKAFLAGAGGKFLQFLAARSPALNKACLPLEEQAATAGKNTDKVCLM